MFVSCSCINIFDGTFRNKYSNVQFLMGTLFLFIGNYHGFFNLDDGLFRKMCNFKVGRLKNYYFQ